MKIDNSGKRHSSSDTVFELKWYISIPFHAEVVATLLPSSPFLFALYLSEKSNPYNSSVSITFSGISLTFGEVTDVVRN